MEDTIEKSSSDPKNKWTKKIKDHAAK